MLANYIVKNNLSKPFKPTWAKKVINVSRIYINRRAKTSGPPKEMFGIKIPRTVEEALRFDKENGNSLWADAIAKETNSLLKYNV